MIQYIDNTSKEPRIVSLSLSLSPIETEAIEIMGWGRLSGVYSEAIEGFNASFSCQY